MSASQALERRFHPEIQFGGFTDLDGTLLFYARVQQLLNASSTVLDVGCGRGTQADDPVRLRRDLRILKGKCRRVIGLDVDPNGASNQFVDEFKLIGPDQRWPVENAAADLVLADFVLEHVSAPAVFFAEAARALRPGGVFCIRTINAWSYVGVASRLVPDRLHARLLHGVQPERQQRDVFPTAYRCNSVPKLRRTLAVHGFEAAVYGAEAEPSYLRFNAVTYALGLMHRRLVPTWFRVGLIAWGRRRRD